VSERYFDKRKITWIKKKKETNKQKKHYGVNIVGFSASMV